MSNLKVFTDGGSRNNPGHAAIGIVIKNIKDEIVDSYKEYIGIKTNNQAEYEAIIKALQIVAGKASRLECYLDSQLVVNQAKGLYKVKNADIRDLLFKLKTAESSFEEVHYNLIPREENKEADKLVNEALDSFLA